MALDQTGGGRICRSTGNRSALGFGYQWVATRSDLATTPPPGRLVDVGGHRLHIWCTGSGGPAVIYESGLGGGAFGWTSVKPEVAKFTEVCTYDRAGMGYSDSGPMPRTSRQIASELAVLLEKSGIDHPRYSGRFLVRRLQRAGLCVRIH